MIIPGCDPVPLHSMPTSVPAGMLTMSWLISIAATVTVKVAISGSMAVYIDIHCY